MKTSKNWLINKLKILVMLIGVSSLVVSFQNCGQNSFKVKEFSSITSASSSLSSENSNNGEEVKVPAPGDAPTNSASTPPCTADSYYLSPDGNDSSNPGTLSKPWKTLTKLMSKQSILKPGDVVCFRGGTYVADDSTEYDDTYDYRFTARGTEAARITYRNYGAEKPIILFDRKNIVNRLMISPAGYTTFDGLTFKQSEESRCLALESDCVTRVDENRYYSKSVRVMTIDADYVTIRNCVIDNFSSIGVATGESSTNAIIEYSTIKNISNHGWYIRGTNGHFRYNTIDGIRQIPGGGRYGVQLQYESSKFNKIYRNIIKNTSAAGVVFSGPISYNEVYNNIFINVGSNRESGTIVSGAGEGGIVGAGNKFYNNTAIGSTVEAVFGDNVRSLAKVEIFDNIFYPSKPISIVKITRTGAMDLSKVRNNIFYNVLDAAPSGNFIVNPLLVNPLGLTAESAMLRAGSPAIDAGLSSLFPDVDFRGAKRVPVSYDIGAFEY